MSTINLYGSSDDLIEVEGPVAGCDEYPGEDEHFVLIGPKGTTRVRVWYTKRGLWAIAVAPFTEGTPMLPVSITQAPNGYSAYATFDDVEQVIHEAKVEA